MARCAWKRDRLHQENYSGIYYLSFPPFSNGRKVWLNTENIDHLHVLGTHRSWNTFKRAFGKLRLTKTMFLDRMILFFRVQRKPWGKKLVLIQFLQKLVVVMMLSQIYLMFSLNMKGMQFLIIIEIHNMWWFIFFNWSKKVHYLAFQKLFLFFIHFITPYQTTKKRFFTQNIEEAVFFEK